MFGKFSGTGFKCFRGFEEREIDDGLVDLETMENVYWSLPLVAGTELLKRL